METKNYTSKIKIEKSVAVIEAEVLPEILEKHKELVISEFKKQVEAPGFRKGNAPDSIVMANIGENKILEESANSVLRLIYPQIIKDNNLMPISSPKITVTKLAFGNPLELKIEVALEPEIKLPDYKKIAKEIVGKKEKVSVTKEEISNVISEIQKMRGKDEKEKLTDESVKGLGNFKDLKDFHKKIEENLTSEKELNNQKKVRQEMIKRITEETKTKLPEIVIESEFEIAKKRFYDELKKRELKKEEYFKNIKKTEEEFLDNEKKSIEFQLKERFVLKKIAEKENISVDENEVAHEVTHLKQHYKDTDERNLRSYVEEILVNEKIFELLEKKD